MLTAFPPLDRHHHQRKADLVICGSLICKMDASVGECFQRIFSGLFNGRMILLGSECDERKTLANVLQGSSICAT
jgi:hypothetical protein